VFAALDIPSGSVTAVAIANRRMAPGWRAPSLPRVAVQWVRRYPPDPAIVASARSFAEVGANVTGFSVGDSVYGSARGPTRSTPSPGRTSSPPRRGTSPTSRPQPYPSAGHRAAGGPQGAGKGRPRGASHRRLRRRRQLRRPDRQDTRTKVTGVASTAKVDLVRSLGVDHVIDYTTEELTAGTAATTSSSTSPGTDRSGCCADCSPHTAELITGGETDG
jgi:hypothetical protein